MSILFDDGASEYLSNTTGCPITSYPFSMACWFNVDTVTINQAAMWIGDKDVGDHWSALWLAGDTVGDPVSAFSHNYGATFTQEAETSAGFTANKWHHGGVTFGGVDDRAAYLDGGNKGTNVSTVGAMDGHDSVAIGRAFDSTAPAYHISGKLAVPAIWNVVLTDEEWALLGAGLAPWFVRPANLVALWLLPHVTGLRDIIGDFDLTAVNGPVSATDHAPIIVPRGIVVPPLVVATGEEYIEGVLSSKVTSISSKLAETLAWNGGVLSDKATAKPIEWPDTVAFVESIRSTTVSAIASLISEVWAFIEDAEPAKAAATATKLLEALINVEGVESVKASAITSKLSEILSAIEGVQTAKATAIASIIEVAITYVQTLIAELTDSPVRLPAAETQAMAEGVGNAKATAIVSLVTQILSAAVEILSSKATAKITMAEEQSVFLEAVRSAQVSGVVRLTTDVQTMTEAIRSSIASSIVRLSGDVHAAVETINTITAVGKIYSIKELQVMVEGVSSVSATAKINTIVAELLAFVEGVRTAQASAVAGAPIGILAADEQVLQSVASANARIAIDNLSVAQIIYSLKAVAKVSTTGETYGWIEGVLASQATGTVRISAETAAFVESIRNVVAAAIATNVGDTMANDEEIRSLLATAVVAIAAETKSQWITSSVLSMSSGTRSTTGITSGILTTTKTKAVTS